MEGAAVLSLALFIAKRETLATAVVAPALDLFPPLPVREYLYMMSDIIALDKSLIVARHFHLMERRYLAPSKKKHKERI